MSNFVWPSGFTPDDQTFSFPMAEIGDPTMAQFMTSPATDMQLINALENQAAYIEGNPAEDKDLELFYYRIVSDVFDVRCRTIYHLPYTVALRQRTRLEPSSRLTRSPDPPPSTPVSTASRPKSINRSPCRTICTPLPGA